MKEHSKMNEKILQRFFSRVDPILSHIASFHKALSVLVASNPTGAGLVWGAFHLLIEISTRTEGILSTILDLNWEISPRLDLFARWRQLFPDKDCKELSESIHKVYSELLKFWVDSIQYLRRGTLGKRISFITSPPLEANFNRTKLRIFTLTERVKDEVNFAHMRLVQGRLATIEAAVSHMSLPSADMFLPRTRIITHSRNHRFFGRQSILDRLDQVLRPNWTQCQRQFILYGPGGSGKTQIALEYTYRNMDHFKAVLWIMADSPEKIEQSFRHTAGLLGMEKSAQESSQAKTYVLQRLSSSEDEFLLCFDNADDMSLIHDCFPRSSRGSILITTRDAAKSEDYAKDTALVTDFNVEDGRDFLATHLPDLDPNSEQNARILTDISKFSHGFPLALSQIAAFIRSGGYSLDQFIEIYENKRENSRIFTHPIPDYHATLSTVWELSLCSLSGASRALLDTVSYLDPDSIPYELFQAAEEVQEESVAVRCLNQLAGPFALPQCLGDLKSQSMIQLNRTAETFSIHRFLQGKAYKELCSDSQRQRDTFEQVLFLLEKTQPVLDNTNRHWSEDRWEGAEKYLSHIKVLGAHFLESPSSFKGFENQIGKLTSQCAMYQFEKFHHQAANESFKMTKSIFGFAEQPDIVVLSDCHRIEARMFNELNEPLQSVQTGNASLEYAEEARRRSLITMDDGRIPRILTGLGNSYSQLGQYEKATEMQLEALKLGGSISGENDAIGIIQLNWGFLLYRQGKYEEAERVLRATLDAFPDMPPANYPLGNTYLALGKVDEAISEHLKGFELYKSRFGPQHAVNAKCMFKVGQILLRHKNEAHMAIPYLRQSFDIYKIQDAPYYNTQAASRGARMLGYALDAVGDISEAQRMLGIAWSLREKATGVRGSPFDTDDDYNAAMFYWDQ
ncbi:hypothetical protein F4677DRAFT_410252 [Hypoxylon crocopeplum]|nr:hypothetical protein F4677DRAFT_410252 [Hypoxylon crocopeplum]